MHQTFNHILLITIILLSLLENNHSDPQTLQLVLKWIRECCIKHEMNRQKIFNAGMLNNLKSVLSKKDEASVSVVKEVCVVLRALTLDDDIRHEYGKAHEHAAAIARQTLHTLTELLSSKVVDSISIETKQYFLHEFNAPINYIVFLYISCIEPVL